MPLTDVVALHAVPVSVAWEIVMLPVVEDCAARLLICPVAPDSLVQVPLTVAPLCVSVAVTVSTTVAPDVTNCHDPVQVPARLKLAVGAEGVESPPHAAKRASTTTIAKRRVIGSGSRSPTRRGRTGREELPRRPVVGQAVDDNGRQAGAERPHVPAPSSVMR